MKIDKVSGTHIPHTPVSTRDTKPETAEPVRQPQSPAVSVNTRMIDQAQSELSTLPDIDLAKVESVKQALARGELNLDIKALAGAVMRFHTGHE
ncbi:flagellar biosynthesis anti-sigma factor FlgM [Photobacterium sp. MCCC 1A19761]|uniref:flagellar biosynthesis anti-sigma factor FlgM n=1 Tax=Photobacterium sp. MCCC 1A19761 TaxID=3115000 RepID=UPI00307F8031